MSFTHFLQTKKDDSTKISFQLLPTQHRHTHTFKEESYFLLPKHGTCKVDYNSS